MLLDLQIDLGKADKLHKDAVIKLAKYCQLIEKALKSGDEGVVESAKRLKLEADEIDKELKYTETLKNNLRAQETIMREAHTKLQANPGKSTIKDFDDLSKSFG